MRGRQKVAIGPFVAPALFVVLALAAVQSLRLGASGLFTHLAEIEIDRWQRAAQPVSAASTNRVAAQLAASLRFAPDNPWSLEKLAVLQLARIRTHRDAATAVAATREAGLHIGNALRERPASAHLWANLALARLYLDQRNETTFVAMRHADELGAWEPAVQETLLFVGLALWEDLDEGLQEARKRWIRRSASRNPQKTLEIVKQFRRLDLVCGLSEYNLLLARDCDPAAKAATGRRGGKG